jgi:hypothetical protein
VHGEHREHRTHSVAHTHSSGRTEWRTQTEEITVVDFDFRIDITPELRWHAVQWSVPDEQPAYRGKMFMEVDAVLMRSGSRYRDIEDSAGGMRRRWTATRREKKTAKAWEHERNARGLPPWVGPEAGGPLRSQLPIDEAEHAYKSSQTVRDWADEYCASPKILKEFTYSKVRSALSR